MPSSARVLLFIQVVLPKFLLINIRLSGQTWLPTPPHGAPGLGVCRDELPRALLFLWEIAHETLASGASHQDHACLCLVVTLRSSLTTDFAPLERTREGQTEPGG